MTPRKADRQALQLIAWRQLWRLLLRPVPGEELWALAAKRPDGANAVEEEPAERGGGRR